MHTASLKPPSNPIGFTLSTGERLWRCRCRERTPRVDACGEFIMNNQDAYQRAKKRVEAKVGFYTHVSIYIVVSVALLIVNLSTSSEYLWFKWPLLGWGIGVFCHALAVFVFSGVSAVSRRAIEKEMHKEASKKY